MYKLLNGIDFYSAEEADDRFSAGSAAEEKLRAEAAEGVLRTDLANEVSRSTAKDNELETKVNELTSKTTEHDSKLTDEITRATEKDNELTTDLAEEIARAQSTERSIQNALLSEATRAQEADSTATQSLIAQDARITTLETKAGAQATEISDIKQDAQALHSKDTELDEKITAEALRSTNEDARVSGEITSETLRATQAEAGLSNDVNSNTAKISALETKVNDLEAFKFPNTVIVGNPTIQQGQVSGFSSNDYMRFPFLVTFANKPFTIYAMFTTGADVRTQQNLFGSNYGFAFAIRDERFVLAMSSDGASWDIGEFTGTHTVLASTTYRIKISWNGSTYKLEYSLDGSEQYISDISHDSTATLYPRQVYIGVGEQNGQPQNSFKGIIDLNHCSIHINGSLIWQGMDDVGIASRLNRDLSNIDNAGIAKARELTTEVARNEGEVTNNTRLVLEEKELSDIFPKASTIQYGVVKVAPTGGLEVTDAGLALNSVPTSESLKSFVMPEYRAITYAFSAPNKKSIKIKANTNIKLSIRSLNAVDNRWFKATTDIIRDLTQDIKDATDLSGTATGSQNGRDYYLYLVPDGAGVKIVVSCNSTFPSDINPFYNANNTRKIGQFHTLCADAGDALTAIVPSGCNTEVTGSYYPVKQYQPDDEDGFYTFYNKRVLKVQTGSVYDVLTVEHPLAGFMAGDILPESVFCLSFRPYADGAGMVYDVDTDMMYDIYLQSGTGRRTLSVYGGTIVNLRQQQNHQDDMRQVKKRLLLDHEFTSMASGSNECTVIKGAASPVTTGGHLDTADRRMISFIGCEDCCGTLWQWAEDYGPAGGSGFSTYDGQGSFGQTYGTCYGLLFGGDWSNSSWCGSRARNGHHARSTVIATFGGRGASRVLRVA